MSVSKKIIYISNSLVQLEMNGDPKLIKVVPNGLGLMERISLIFVAALILSASAAASGAFFYGFGSKVGTNDLDIGNPLCDFCAWFGYRDIGDQINIFDQRDPVYLDLDLNHYADLDDVRITPSSYFSPGSKVRQTDPDIDSPIIELFAWSIVFSDLEGNDIFDLKDMVYLHNTSLGNKIAPGDIRLSSSWNFPAGSRVDASDEDSGISVLVITSENTSENITNRADFRFYNANGNYYLSEEIYDTPDQVYLHLSVSKSNQSYPTIGFVDANDLRLSI